MASSNTSSSADISPSPRRRFLRYTMRALLAILLLFVIAFAAASLWGYRHLQNSLARLDGEIALDSLLEGVTVERDALGVPTIRAQSRVDISHAIGFLHAQERFFQMDLIRRQAAGELAELFGPMAARVDQRVRVHQFRTRAQRVLEGLPVEDQQHLEAYAAGVQNGLEALQSPPFEYALLRTTPTPWQPEDTLLAVYAMYLDLQGGQGRSEANREVLYSVMPLEMAQFLDPKGTEWDAPIIGEAFATAPIPGPEVYAPRVQQEDALPKAADLEPVGYEPDNLSTPWRNDPFLDDPFLRDHSQIGSNNWAVAGSLSTHGGALLANDMHLGHSVPNIWYRASLIYPDPQNPGQERRITGVTLPGAMVIIAGSTGNISWGFTNSYGDWSDLVLLEPVPGNENAYQTPQGPKELEKHPEILKISGGEKQTTEVLTSIWGPVIGRDHLGRRYAQRWVAHDPQAVNLELLDLEDATSAEEAITIANRAGSPAQNFVVADHHGRIGWTIMGPMPKRFGFDGRRPSSWANGSRGWDGWLTPEAYPKVLDPESGRIWTANSRVVGGEMYALVGDGGYDLGARAKQIRDGLFALDKADEKNLLAIQLDDRALFLERWHDLLLQTLTPEAIADQPQRQELRRLVEQWNGRADVESAAYRLVRGFRIELRQMLFDFLTAPCKAADEQFSTFRLSAREGPLWKLVTEQPEHLLDPRFKTWHELMLTAADQLVEKLLEGGGALEDKTWGDLNRIRVQHPLSQAVPLLSRWLDMPTLSLAGDSDMPRVQSRTFGASQRMVVSPGREEQGYFHMPTGQSGHPLSPFYANSHQAWVEGEPTPFLPGETLHTLRLIPSDR